MREIKFRGKRLDNGEWVFGNYQAGKGIHPHMISWWVVHQFEGDVSDEIDVTEVDPSTVSQYTGLKDKNGVEIYEGDLVTARKRSDTATFTGYVRYKNAQYFVNYLDYESFYVPLIEMHESEYEPIKVIGNVHDKE